MRHDFLLADIGEGLEEAEIIRWLVDVGDHVERDQPLVEVMTDKSNAELPAPTAGTVLALGGQVGDMLAVGELVAAIQAETGSDDSASSPSAARSPRETPEPADGVDRTAAQQDADTANPSAEKEATARIKASPTTRRRAAELGVDLSVVAGSGPGGRILLSDIDQAADVSPVEPIMAPVLAPKPEPASTNAQRSQAPPLSSEEFAAPSAEPGRNVMAPGTVPLRGIRRATARNMAQSWTDIPHIHAFDEVDATAMLELRNGMRSSGNPTYASLTPLAFFVAAVARAFVSQPQANASLDMANETITYHPRVNVGVAVASSEGLVVPVVHGAGELSFEALVQRLEELVTGARAGTLGRQDFAAGTVTITNFGSLGGVQATPLIRPPESMIVGFGSIAERPMVVDGLVVARPTMHTVVGADHRLLDGDVATSVLTLVGSLLAAPLPLVL